jgi:hypothetical protein
MSHYVADMTPSALGILMLGIQIILKLENVQLGW